MSEIGPEVDGDDSDLKECLLETLKADGTLKQIQDQLSAAVYAAFYRQTTQPVKRTPSPLNVLLSKQNGIAAVSLLVDFLQSFELKKTLNVLMHETGLDESKLERRENLVQRYGLSSISDKSPVLPALMDSFGNLSIEPPQLSKAVVLDQDSDNEFDKPIRNNGSIPGNLDNNFSPSSGTLVTSKDQRPQNRSPPHSIDSTRQPSGFPREQTGYADTDKNLSSDVHQSQQQFQWSSRRDLEKGDEYAVTTNPPDDRSASVAYDALLGSSTNDHLQETSRSHHGTPFANTVAGVYAIPHHSVIQTLSPTVTLTLIQRPQQADFAHSLTSCHAAAPSGWSCFQAVSFSSFLLPLIFLSLP
ncbi:hypothetical protein ECG_06511 [Echinococcus granulosus]|nr:hypothetical protein ECG_06511 [Echinococcus granulosus]